MLSVLFACGGGAGGSNTTTGPAGDTLSLQITLPGGLTGNKFSAGTSATITATLYREGNSSKPVSNAKLTFVSKPEVATLGLASGQTLTDASGKGATTLTGVAQGVDTLTVTAEYTDTSGKAQTLTTSVVYEVTAATTVPAPQLTLAMTGGTSVPSGSQTMVSATLKDANGTPVPNALVTFTNDTTYATFNPEAGTALTDSNGVASIGVIGSAKLGADKILAVAQASGIAGVDTSVSASLNYQVISSNGSGPKLSLALQDMAGQSISSMAAGQDAVLSAVFTDGAGAPIRDALISFSATFDGSDTLVELSNLSDLSDASGRGKTNLIGQSTKTSDTGVVTLLQGVVTITVTASKGSISATEIKRFSYIPSTPRIASLTVSLPAGVTSLPASSSTLVTAKLVNAATGAVFLDPISVTFNSACVLAGRASITGSVVNIGGTAQATYTDQGCTGSDVITATANGRSVTTTIAISAAAASSLLFVDATPTTLGIKGSGTNEVAVVRFRLVDKSGNPVSGQTVNFALDTTAGGLKLNNSSAATDTNGYASALVQAGTIGTPLTVTATLNGTSSIWAQSRQLYVSTKIPHQNGFSLAVSKPNPEFYDYNGEQITLSVYVSDRFGLPVPDGTVVNFRTEGGIGTIRDPASSSSPVGGCVTSASTCTVQLTSSGDRSVIANGRQTIMAYTVGEDSFDDNNGNGIFDGGDTFPPAANASSYVQGEAYVDAGESGAREANEEYIDYNVNGSYDAADGKYRGQACGAGSSCAGQTSRHVYRSAVIIWSGSKGNATLSGTGYDAGTNTITIPSSDSDGAGPLPSCGTAAVLTLSVLDNRNQIMPAGTVIALSSTAGTVSTESASFTVPEQITAPSYTVTLRSARVLDTTANTCTAATTPTGNLNLTITTPLGGVTTYNYSVVDQ